MTHVFLVNIKMSMDIPLQIVNNVLLDFIIHLQPRVATPVQLECIKHLILLVVQSVWIVRKVSNSLTNIYHVQHVVLEHINLKMTKTTLGVLGGKHVRQVKRVLCQQQQLIEYVQIVMVGNIKQTAVSLEIVCWAANFVQQDFLLCHQLKNVQLVLLKHINLKMM